MNPFDKIKEPVPTIGHRPHKVSQTQTNKTMCHPCLPETMTPENLAQWITENQIEKLTHVEKTEHTPEYVSELEHKSSVASRALDQLAAVKKDFDEYLKNGTPVNEGLEEADEAEHLPITITIPPTRGTKILKANREWADKLILAGFTGNDIELFMIPYPEERRVIAVDIEGNEWEGYSRDMSPDEINNFGQLFAAEKEELKAEKPKGKRKKKTEEEPFV